MKNSAAKVKNRIISIACIGVFFAALVIATVVTIKLIGTLNERQTLLKTRDELIAERDWQKRNDSYDDDDYLNVYVKDNYAIIDSDETIFVFTK